MLTNLIQRIYAASPNTSAPDSDTLGSALTVNTTVTDVQGLVTLIITWIIYIAGVLAFIYLVVSGITYITAGGNAEQAKKGQQGLINAIIGIVVIVLAYVILQSVNSIAQN
jgi:hypothetical protein